MTTAYTSLLGLALPVTGELSGTWGTTVNDQLTALLDTAVAGSTTITSDADITLTDTTGAANEARQAIILWATASGTTTRNITAPARSKGYIVINKAVGAQSIVVRGAGPTTGVTIVQGEYAVIAWNGSDFVKVSNQNGAANFTTVDATNIEVTNLKAKDGTSAGSIADSTGVVTLASSVLTTTDINGGTVDNVIIGGATAAAGSFTTVDATNIEVTNLKAKDGTSAGSIADSTGVVTLASSVLTTTDINGGTVDNVIIGGATAAAGSFTTLTASTNLSSTRINPRTSTTASTATLTPDISANDQYNLTAQAVGLTVAAPTGTPVDGNKLILRILDNGTSQTITWNATYTVVGPVLPTVTTINKMLYVGCIYNSTNTRWDVIAVVLQA